MIFSRVLPFFALALSFSILSVAKPVAETSVLERTDGDVGTADVAAVLTRLKASTDSTLSQMNTLMDSNHANSANIVPLMHDLTKSFTTAGDSLKALKGKVSARQLGPTDSEIAALLADIIAALVTTLGRLFVRAIIFLPTLMTLIVSLDLVLHDLLVAVEALVGGVLGLVTGLLVEVGGSVVSVGLSLVAVVLGLGL
ncbi:hypothetical protein PLEOSDRAFT_1108837 [Pleurotus ostreatus PC15]|uniref:Uncharacterized protein n=1 Tax=Pleurotus ostreatus (strain PC15) TaxID=1137138 RepID=A0A067N5A1_PLEO1|nr:hypothetical protein PLEOSDRAFT_1108837 [Pleurotus ostreatus PC15]